MREANLDEHGDGGLLAEPAPRAADETPTHAPQPGSEELALLEGAGDEDPASADTLVVDLASAAEEEVAASAAPASPHAPPASLAAPPVGAAPEALPAQGLVPAAVPTRPVASQGALPGAPSLSSFLVTQIDQRLSALSLQMPPERDLARWAVPAVLGTLVVGLVSRAGDYDLAWVWAVLVLVVWTTRWVGGDQGPRAVASAAAGYWSVLGFVAVGGLPAVGALAAASIVSTSARPAHQWLPWPQWHAALMHRAGGFAGRVAAAPVWVLCTAGLVGLLLVAATGLAATHGVAFVLLAIPAWAATVLSATGPVSSGSRGVGRIGFLLCLWAWGCFASLLWPSIVLMLGLTAVSALRDREPRSTQGVTR